MFENFIYFLAVVTIIILAVAVIGFILETMPEKYKRKLIKKIFHLDY